MKVAFLLMVWVGAVLVHAKKKEKTEADQVDEAALENSQIMLASRDIQCKVCKSMIAQVWDEVNKHGDTIKAILDEEEVVDIVDKVCEPGPKPPGWVTMPADFGHQAPVPPAFASKYKVVKRRKKYFFYRKDETELEYEESQTGTKHHAIQYQLDISKKERLPRMAIARACELTAQELDHDIAASLGKADTKIRKDNPPKKFKSKKKRAIALAKARKKAADALKKALCAKRDPCKQRNLNRDVVKSKKKKDKKEL